MQIRNLRAKYLGDLALVEAELQVMKVCRSHREEGFWKLLSGWLQAEEKACIERLLVVQGSEAEMREIRAGINAYRYFRRLPDYTDSEYAEAEKRLTGLRNKLQRLDDLGPAAEVDPQWEDQLAQIKLLARNRT